MTKNIYIDAVVLILHHSGWQTNKQEKFLQKKKRLPRVTRAGKKNLKATILSGLGQQNVFIM